MITLKYIWVWIMLVLLLPAAILSQSETFIHYQGRLSENGTPVSGTQEVPLVFEFYSDSLVQALAYSESHSINPHDGVFNVLIGPLPDSLFINGANSWIKVRVDQANDLTIERIASVPYAVWAQASKWADSAYSLSAPGNESATVIIDNGSRVGIGTNEPKQKLSVSDTGFVALDIGNNDAALSKQLRFLVNDSLRWYFSVIGDENGGDTGSDFLIASRDDNTNNTIRFFIDRQTGNTGIGTASPNGSLHIIQPHAGFRFDGSASTSGYTSHFLMDDSGLNIGHNSGSRNLYFQTDDITRMTVQSNGNIWTAGDLSVTGNLNVTGMLTKGDGYFKIDHPLDPLNKFLYHSFVESPDMMNVYNGNVVLDENGEAVVELSHWFEALNKDFRYQLTPIGGGAPNLHVAETIAKNQFKIAGGSPGLLVSWQVTGVRDDPYAKMNRIQVEQEKSLAEKGTLLHPEAYQNQHVTSEGLPSPPTSRRN